MFLPAIAPVLERTADVCQASQLRAAELEGQLAHAVSASDKRRCRVQELERALEETKHNLEDARRRSYSLHGAELAQYVLATKDAHAEARSLESQLTEARQATERFERLWNESHGGAASPQRGQGAEVRRRDFLRIPELTRQARAGQEAEERVASLESELGEARDYGRSLETRLSEAEEASSEAAGAQGHHLSSVGSIAQLGMQGGAMAHVRVASGRQRRVHFEEPLVASGDGACLPGSERDGWDNAPKTVLEQLSDAQAVILDHEAINQDFIEARLQQRNRFDLAQELHEERLAAVQSELHLEQKALHIAESQHKLLKERLEAAERASAEELLSAGHCFALESELEEMRQAHRLQLRKAQELQKQQQETTREREANESLRELLDVSGLAEPLRRTDSRLRMQAAEETVAKLEAEVAEREATLAQVDINYSHLEARIASSEAYYGARAGALESKLRTVRGALAEAGGATQRRCEHRFVTALDWQVAALLEEKVGPSLGGVSPPPHCT